LKNKFDFNSSENQEIKRKFVAKEVIYCQTALVEECLNKQMFKQANV